MMTIKEFTSVFTWQVVFEIWSVGYEQKNYGKFHMNTIPKELWNKYIYLVEVNKDNGTVVINFRF